MEAMQLSRHWTYAVPLEVDGEALGRVLESSDFKEIPNEEGRRFERGGAIISLVASEALDVTVLEARGGEGVIDQVVVQAVAQVLELTGFYAQSSLLSTASDLTDLEALRTSYAELLAHEHLSDELSETLEPSGYCR